MNSENSKKASDPNITLIIKTPNGDWTQTFRKTTKIQDVIDATVAHFGFSTNGQYELRKEDDPNTVLKPERTLVSYHLKDNDVLIFIDFGQAV